MLQIRRKKRKEAETRETDAAQSAAEQQEGSDAIIEGINAEAQKQSAELIEQAEKAVGQKLKSWELQKRRMRADARQDAEAKAEQLRTNGQSRLKMAQRRRDLQLQELLVSEITQEALEAAEALIGGPTYEEILEGLIVEAAIGIRCDTAIVSSSAQELPMITEALLQRVVEELKERTGRQMSLRLSQEAPLPGQGVLLSSEDGKVAFSNQIRTRLLRYQSEIRHLIHRRLLTGLNEEQA